jgi:hypothetical protein
VTITIADGSDVGATFKFGGHVAVGREVGGGGRGRAGVDLGSGRSWTLPNEAAAADFVARFGDKATIKGKLVDQVRSRCSFICDAIGWRPHERLPEPDETFDEGGAVGGLRMGFGFGGGDGEVDAQVKGLLGRRVARDGTTTWYLELSTEASGALDLSGGALTFAGGADAVVSYEVGPDGRPRSVGVTVAGRASGNAGAAGEAGGRALARGGLRSVDGGLDELLGGVVELEGSLDLTDPANLAVARAVVGGILDPGAYPDMPGRVRALGERIVAGSQVDARLYARRSSSQKYGAELGLGATVGADLERSSEQLDLLAAFTRLPGLPFLPRDDCRAA